MKVIVDDGRIGKAVSQWKGALVLVVFSPEEGGGFGWFHYSRLDRLD